jgi:tRNA pseudouridine38-40 synthase
VHALGQVAHFDTESKLPPAAVLAEGNRRLPGSIVIREASEAFSDFHARFSATGKFYRYLAYTGLTRPAYFRSRAGWFPRGGDRGRMEEAGRLLLGSHDFSAFAAAGRETADPVRTVRRLELLPLGDDLLAFEIEADGFLYRMVRNIVGTIFEAGRGRFTPAEISKILESGNRTLAGPTAPPEGLCLVRVFYSA